MARHSSSETWAGDHVLGRWPSRCKKRDGQLLLLANRLIHVPDSATHKVEAAAECLNDVQTLDFDEVQTYQFSQRKPGQDLALIQFITQSGKKIIIELTSRAERWVHLAELKHGIDIPLQQSKKKAEELTAQLDSKMRAVMASKELKQKYNCLVKQANAMSSVEFLNAHSQEIALHVPLPTAPAIELAALHKSCVDPAAACTSRKKDDLVVQDEQKKAIFQELPALKHLYESAVPLLVTPAQFWKRCFASRYYLDALGREVLPNHPADPLFDSLETPSSIVRPPAEIIAATADLNADLTGDLVRESHVRAARESKGNLIAKLNERSAGALAALVAPPSAGHSRAAVERPTGVATESQTTVTGLVEPATNSVAPDLLASLQRRRAALRLVAEEWKAELGNPQLSPRAVILKLHETIRACPFKRSQCTAGFDEYTGTRSSTTMLLQSCNVGQSKWRKFAGSAAPTEGGAKWSLRSATDELLQAERMKGRSAALEGGPPGEVAEVMARARALLQHFWASRRGEPSLQERLVCEMKSQLLVLDSWQQVVGGREQAAKHAARSLIQPLRHACAVYEQLLVASVARNLSSSLGGGGV